MAAWQVQGCQDTPKSPDCKHAPDLPKQREPSHKAKGATGTKRLRLQELGGATRQQISHAELPPSLSDMQGKFIK